jgi:hypothetical protein
MDEFGKQAVLKSLENFGEARVLAGGWSMWPFIRNRDLLVIKKDLPITVGRVAVVFIGTQMVAHRIIWKSRDPTRRIWAWIQGDFSPLNPARINIDEIAGVVACCHRSGKSHRCWLSGPLSLAAIPLGRIFSLIFKVGSFFQTKKQGFISKL